MSKRISRPTERYIGGNETVLNFLVYFDIEQKYTVISEASTVWPPSLTKLDIQKLGIRERVSIRCEGADISCVIMAKGK